MSKKRIRYVLAGKEMTSSSGTEDSSSSDEENTRKQSENQNLRRTASATTSNSTKRMIKKSPEMEQPDSTCAEQTAPIDTAVKEDINSIESDENSDESKTMIIDNNTLDPGMENVTEEEMVSENEDFSEKEEERENSGIVSSMVEDDDEFLDYDEVPVDDLWFEEEPVVPEKTASDKRESLTEEDELGGVDFDGSSPCSSPQKAEIDEVKSESECSEKEEGEVENYESDEENQPDTNIEQPDSTSAEQDKPTDLDAREDDNNIDSNERPYETQVNVEIPTSASSTTNEQENCEENCGENVENSEVEELVNENYESSENEDAENPVPVSTMADDDDESLDYDEAPLEDLWFREETIVPDRHAKNRNDSLTDENDNSPIKPGIAGTVNDASLGGSSPSSALLKAKNNESKHESTDKEEGEVENYDSDEDMQPSTSKYSDQELYPPGMEPHPPPSTLLMDSNQNQKSGDLDNENGDEKIIKKTSLVSIKALYNQLKAEKEKKATKPKVYSAPLPVWTLDEQKKTKIDSEKTPAGPHLPPEKENADSSIAQNIEKPENSEAESAKDENAIKKSSKKKSSILLTTEFLEDLNRKKQEHELEMAKKAEMLENLKRKRQMLEQEEKETEEMFKKQNDLGLFDDQENAQNNRRRSKTTSRNHSTGSPDLIPPTKLQNDDKNTTLNIEEGDYFGSPSEDLSDFLIGENSPKKGTEAREGPSPSAQNRQISSPVDQKPDFNFKELGKNLSVSVRLSETGDRMVTVNEKADKMRRAFKLSSSSSLEEGEVEHPDKVYGDYDKISSEDENDQLFLPTRRQSTNSTGASSSKQHPDPQQFYKRIQSRDLPKSRDPAKSRDPFDMKSYRKPVEKPKYPKRKYQPDDYDSDFLKRVSSDSGEDFDKRNAGKRGDKKLDQDHPESTSKQQKKRKKSSKKSEKRSGSHDSASSDDDSAAQKKHKSRFKQEKIDQSSKPSSSCAPLISSRVVAKEPKAIFIQKSTATNVTVNRSISMTCSTSSQGKLHSKVEIGSSSKRAGTGNVAGGARSGSAHEFEPPLATSAALLQKLELYELEMRARAIRALMKKQNDADELD